MISNHLPHPQYTFKTFVVGNSNRFAYAAARGAAESPGLVHNPLFIYSGVGLGKTHLLGAVGNYILQNKQEMQVVYVTAEWFVNELLEALEKNSVDEFRNRYRAIDCLLIDDVQFLGEKDRPQSELIHTFDTLYTLQKQIVFTSDRPPKSVTTIQERLRSRFEGGLIADIQMPDFETRVAILQKKAVQKKLEIEEDIVYEIAKSIKTNVRELEGFLNKLIALYSMDKNSITLDWVKETLRNQRSASKSVSSSKPKTQQPQSSLGDEFGSFVADIGSDLGDTIQEKEEEERLRSEYRKKLYIWEMKGFDVSRLQRVIDSDLHKVKQTFDEFTIDAKRLMELQKQVACMDIRGMENKVKNIERYLFSPDRLEEVEQKIKELEIAIERRKEYRASLNSEFTFDNFVIDEANQMVAYVAKMISESPAILYNPLFIHGGIGTGKTHLLHAIGNATVYHKPGLNLYYVSADTFARKLIKAIEERKTDEFRARYNEIDMLLIDDIQLLAEKERTQEEIFHFFNTLYNMRKQIVISSDRHPEDLQRLHERLRSRFEGGLVVELTPPDENARREIINQAVSKHDILIMDAAVDYIAGKFTKNIRELMGGLNNIIAHAKVKEATISENLARNVLGDEVKSVPEKEPEPIEEEVTVDVEEMEFAETEEKVVDVDISNLLDMLITDWEDETSRLDTEI